MEINFCLEGKKLSRGLVDELKGIAILAILLNHAGGVLVWRNLLHGDLGTDMFFLLSGCALALGHRHDATAVEFFKRRLLRIAPAYWIVFTIYLLLDRWLLQRELPLGNALVHYLGLHSFFGDAYAFAVNDGFWFITAILCFYAFFAAFHRLLDERPDRLLLAGAVVSLATISVINAFGQGGLMGHVGFRMGDFVCGMLIGHALRRGRLRLPLTPTLGVALLVYLYLPYAQSVVLYSTAVGGAVLLFYSLAVRPRVTANEKGVRWLAFLGKHSLEIFLIHQPLMREFNYYVLARFGSVTAPTQPILILGILVSVAISLLLAVELHRFTKKLVGWLNVREERREIAIASVSSLTILAYASGPGRPFAAELRLKQRAISADGTAERRARRTVVSRGV